MAYTMILARDRLQEYVFETCPNPVCEGDHDAIPHKHYVWGKSGSSMSLDAIQREIDGLETLAAARRVVAEGTILSSEGSIRGGGR